MSRTLFHEGHLTKLFLDEDHSEKRVLVKTTGNLDRVFPGNAALVNEYQLLKDLKIDGVREVLSLEQTDNGPELHLQFLKGVPLSKAVSNPEIDLRKFLHLTIRLADILDKVHAHNIIHKDINPSNILYHSESDQIHIIDFGISARVNIKMQFLGNPEKLEGTLQYMSPEQTGRVDRKVDTRTDLYSFGATLYRLLTGANPFAGKSALELVHAHIASKPKPIAGKVVAFSGKAEVIPQALSQIVLKLMAKNPEDRYKSAQGLKHDLHACLAQLEEGTDRSFELAKSDFSSVFRLSEKLYGVDAEIDLLANLFEQTKYGKSSVVFIKGYSGVGKSSLVNELHKHVVTANGIVISGKFNQLEKNVPHHALLKALNELVDYLLSETDTNLTAWRERILDNLNGLGRVLTEMLPSLEKIIGEQPEVPILSAIESQNRRDYLLHQFLGCFSGLGQPLLLFIDDLQWADESSLDLFKKLLIDKSNQGLYFIGAYRDNEVSDSHPLAHALADIGAEREVNFLKIGNLKKESIQQLIVDSLGCSLEDGLTLANQVFVKTKGNAFFSTQFLKSLYQEQVLQYDYEHHKWHWDESKIADLGITDNVIDLLTQRVSEVDQDAVDALKMASCIGHVFDLASLSIIIQKPADVCLALLRTAITNELIQPKDSITWKLTVTTEHTAPTTYFEFVHDKIQQALYEMIPEGLRQKTHLQIGRLLIRSTSDHDLEERIFDICNQINEGLDFVEKVERLPFAKLNYTASKRARSGAAFQQAYSFARAALKLVGNNVWSAEYKLALGIATEAMESAFLTGQSEAMEEHMQSILANGKNPLDKIKVYHTKVDAYSAQHDHPKAVAAGVDGLKELGVRFPANPKMVHVFMGLGATKMKLAGKKTESLIDLPEMTDPYILEAMPLMERISPPAYMMGSQLFPLLVFRMVDLSLKYGNSALSAFGYASFAITLSGVLGDYDGGYRFANLSLKVRDKFNSEPYRVKVYFVNYCFVRHWKEPARDMIAPLMEAYRSGMQVGNIFSGIWVACYALIWKFYSASPLPDLQSELDSYKDTFRKLKQDGAYMLAHILERSVACLINNEKADSDLSSAEMPESELAQRCAEADDKTGLFFYHLNKLQLAYWFRDYSTAKSHADRAKEYLDAVVGLHYIPQYHFYSALIALANPQSKSGAIKLAKKAIKKFKIWAKHAPANYAHKLKLMQAELNGVQGYELEARKAFDEAIDQAGVNGYVQEQALAFERAGLYYEQLGVDYLAQNMLQHAYRKWQEWGAKAKLTQLEVGSGVRHKGTNHNVTLHQTLQTVTSQVSLLDKESVLKSSAILASEINPERLMNRFMQVMIENSGADRGVLLIKDENEWVIRASVATDESSVNLQTLNYTEDATDRNPQLPHAVINYVIHSSNKVLLNDVSHDQKFSRDHYVEQVQPKALVAYPLINKSELIGILYLENKLTSGVFTEERLEMLNILGPQVAVTLENANLYTQTIELSNAYQRFVPEQFLAHLGKKSILDVHIGDQVEQEMTVMFSDIRGFTALSEKLKPEEIFGFINDYLSAMEPIIRKYGGFIDKYIGDAIMAIFPGVPDDALDAAQDMVNAMEKLNVENAVLQKNPTRLGIGIHTGILMLGTVGGENRMDSTVISDAVNVASRIESMTKEYKVSILLSESTKSKLQSPGQYKLVKVDEVILKGKSTPTEMYTLQSK